MSHSKKDFDLRSETWGDIPDYFPLQDRYLSGYLSKPCVHASLRNKSLVDFEGRILVRNESIGQIVEKEIANYQKFKMDCKEQKKFRLKVLERQRLNDLEFLQLREKAKERYVQEKIRRDRILEMYSSQSPKSKKRKKGKKVSGNKVSKKGR